MKTILIYDQFGEDDIQFAVLDGDHSRFDRVFMNSTHELADDLYELMFTDDGERKVELMPTFPTEVLAQFPDSKVIVIGFIP